MKTRLPGGMMIQHNFVKPHMTLGGMTPSDAALIDLPGTDRWKTLIQRGQELKKLKDSKKRKKTAESAASLE